MASAIRYERRRPETTLLYRVLQQNLETFLAARRDEQRPLPGFVERELHGFLACGSLAHGFIRARCTDCGASRLVAFSCKGRGFCPSCGGRRMAEHAARWVDRILPVVPVRQWVLSLPFALRMALAYDPELCTLVLGVFVRTVLGAMRRRARRERGLADARSGALTVIQRAGSALNLNVHLHTLVLDGVFTAGAGNEAGGPLRFEPLAPPDAREMARGLARLIRRTQRLLERRGWPDAVTSAIELEQPSLLGEVYAASAAQRIATGERRGLRVMRLGDRIDVEDVEHDDSPRCVRVGGWSLHADVQVGARDRRRRERLCRYLARPPLASERLTELADGRIAHGLRHRWRDGTTHVAFTSLELIEKLVALVPRPRAHVVRYHGVLAPHARDRPHVVVFGRRDASEPARAEGTHGSGPGSPAPDTGITRGQGRNLAWAELMRRVFELDVLECPDCRGRMRVIAAITAPRAIVAILDCLGLATRPPPLAPARPRIDPLDPQVEFFDDAER